MTTLEERQRAFHELGYTAIPNFVPEEIAHKVRSVFLHSDWDKVEQVRSTHFQHVFKTDIDCLPHDDEEYIARFSRAESIERRQRIRDIVGSLMVPALEKISGRKIAGFDIRALKMDAGDVMRTHIDDYAGDVGFIWYLCSRWVWDWGGILQCAVGDRVDSALPRFNQVVVVNHGQRRVPHWVTTIADYAKESRMMLVGFSQPG